MQEILVKKINTIRDGGTTIWQDRDGKKYWKDWRYGSPTKGLIYDRSLTEDDAQILDVKLIEVLDNLEIK
jgi:hypothetical protein